jgi:hypothetical protein
MTTANPFAYYGAAFIFWNVAGLFVCAWIDCKVDGRLMGWVKSGPLFSYGVAINIWPLLLFMYFFFKPKK